MAPSRSDSAWTLVATGLGLFMIFLDATITNVALPDIQQDFGAGESGLQWVVAGYSVTMAMFMMWGASFADTRGRRLAYVCGLALFALASIGCALAPSIGFLSGARAVQGVGAALVNVASLALVSSRYTDPAQKARAIGAWTGIAAVGLAIGPLVGGVLTDTFGWRSIFVINPIVAVVAIVLTFAVIDESKDPRERRYDWTGQILFIVGVGALTYALVEGPHSGWLSPEILTLLVGSLVVLAAFVATELRAVDPMMDVRLFRLPVYSTAIFTVFAVLFAIYGSLLVITQYFQNVKGYSAEEAGVLMLAMTAPVVVAAPVAGRIAGRIGGRPPVLVGLMAISAGTAILAVGRADALPLTVVALFLIGIAGGLCVAPTTAVAMDAVSVERTGMASGILSAQRAIGSTAGFAVMGSVLAAVVAAVLPGKFEPYISDPTARQQAVDAVVEAANPRAVTSLLAPGEPLSSYLPDQAELLRAADDAFILGVRAAEAVAFVMVASALVAVFFLFPKREEVGVVVEIDVEVEGGSDSSADATA